MRLLSRACITFDCEEYAPSGFRKCPLCMRGLTPNKRGEEE